MDNSTTFYVVRHGQTQWNIEHRLQGHGDSPLTEEGKEEIAKLEKVFHDIHFDHAFSSDLLRAQQTAELLTLRKNLAIQTTHLLRERSFGKHEGKLWDDFVTEHKELVEEYEKLSEEERWKFTYGNNMESNDDVTQRLLIFLREAAVAYTGKTVLVVTHGGVLRALLRHLGIPAKSGHGLVKNLAYVQLLSNGDEFEVVTTSGITFPDE